MEIRSIDQFDKAQHIPLPADFPLPRFIFGQEVYLKNTENAKGLIAGMQCVSSSPWEYRPWEWRYMVYLSAINILDHWFGEEDLSVEKWPEK